MEVTAWTLPNPDAVPPVPSRLVRGALTRRWAAGYWKYRVGGVRAIDSRTIRGLDGRPVDLSTVPIVPEEV
jgi:hypothetical protein